MNFVANVTRKQEEQRDAPTQLVPREEPCAARRVFGFEKSDVSLYQNAIYYEVCPAAGIASGGKTSNHNS